MISKVLKPIVVFVLVFLLVSGCSAGEYQISTDENVCGGENLQYIVQLVDIGGPVPFSERELSEWFSSSWEDPNARPELEVLGLKGTYDYSKHPYDRPYQENVYDSGIGSFSVDATSGDVVSWYSGKLPSEDIRDPLDENQCRDIAERFLMKYTELTEFEVTSKELQYDEYVFNFTKQVAPDVVSESASIYVRKNGEIIRFYFTMLNKVPDNSFCFDVEKARAAVTDRVEKECSSVKDKYDEINTKEEIRYTILKDGRPALIFDVDIEFVIVRESGGRSIVPGCYLFVVTEETI